MQRRNGRGRGDNRYRGGGRKQTTQPRGLFADGIWHCDCTPRLPAEHFKVKKDGPNHGRWFYTCQQQEPKRCKFFLWEDEAKPREGAAVLNNSRTEPTRGSVQDGWDAGRSRATNGNGMVAKKTHEGQTWNRNDESTASPSPPINGGANGVKRKAGAADLDTDEDMLNWSLTGQEERELVMAADLHATETPQKAQKMGIYATPGTTGKRKLPWVEPPQTPVAAEQHADYFNTPSKAPTASTGNVIIKKEPTTPSLGDAIATAKTPSAPIRHRDALTDPDDSSSSLTSEVTVALASSSVHLPADAFAELRKLLTKHDLKTQGIAKGRDISRLAIKAKDAKIAELQAKIESLEAEREMDRSVIRALRWEKDTGQTTGG